MKSPRIPMPNFLFIAPLLLMNILYQQTISASTPANTTNFPCQPSSCGSLRNISFPFRLTTDPKNCGEYDLSCENNRAVLYLIPNSSTYLYVEAINYRNSTIRVVDPNIHKDNYSSLPFYLLNKNQFPDYHDAYQNSFATQINFCHTIRESIVFNLTQTVIFMRCGKRLENSRPHNFVDTAPYINGSALSQPGRPYSYAVVDRHLNFWELPDSCRIDLMTFISSRKGNVEKKSLTSFSDIHTELAYGFELTWENRCCLDGIVYEDSEFYCRYYQNNLDNLPSQARTSDEPCGKDSIKI